MTRRALADIEDEVALGAARIDDAAIELADADRVGELAALLASRLSIPQVDTVRILGGRPEQPVALLCRGAGLSLNGYSAVLRMRCRQRASRLAGPEALLHDYLKLARLPARELSNRLQAELTLEDSGA
ncbi:MAG TPA: hypothetical protein VHG27_10390 [Xanthobacteraceae bacterium]|nr:hypothetical protein [Xanthobacteraceae bacterium]